MTMTQKSLLKMIQNYFKEKETQYKILKNQQPTLVFEVFQSEKLIYKFNLQRNIELKSQDVNVNNKAKKYLQEEINTFNKLYPSQSYGFSMALVRSIKSKNQQVYCIVLPYLGETLQSLNDVNRKQPLKLSLKLKIIKQIMNHLARLHNSQILHNDIKPHNITFDQINSKAYLIDFQNSLRIKKDSMKTSKYRKCFLYASLRQGEKFNTSYSCEYQSLYYIMYEIYFNELPWCNNQIDLNSKERIEQSWRFINQIKKSHLKRYKQLIKNNISKRILTLIFKAITQCNFKEKPDLELLNQLLDLLIRYQQLKQKNQEQSSKIQEKQNLCDAKGQNQISLYFSKLRKIQKTKQISKIKTLSKNKFSGKQKKILQQLKELENQK